MKKNFKHCFIHMKMRGMLQHIEIKFWHTKVLLTKSKTIMKRKKQQHKEILMALVTIIWKNDVDCQPQLFYWQVFINCEECYRTDNNYYNIAKLIYTKVKTLFLKWICRNNKSLLCNNCFMMQRIYIAFISNQFLKQKRGMLQTR